MDKQTLASYGEYFNIMPLLVMIGIIPFVPMIALSICALMQYYTDMKIKQKLQESCPQLTDSWDLFSINIGFGRGSLYYKRGGLFEIFLHENNGWLLNNTDFYYTYSKRFRRWKTMYNLSLIIPLSLIITLLAFGPIARGSIF